MKKYLLIALGLLMTMALSGCEGAAGTDGGADDVASQVVETPATEDVAEATTEAATEAENTQETATNEEENLSDEWKAEYIGILEELRKDLPPYSTTSEGYTEETPIGYLLYDIDKDGIPEMIVKRGTCEADYNGHIYAVTGTGCKLIEEDVGLGHCSLYTDPDGGILFYQAHMGQAFLQRATFDVGKLKYEDVFSEGDDAMVEEYTPVGDIVKGAARLSFGRMYQDLGVNRYEDILKGMNEKGGDYAKEQEPDKTLADALDQVLTYGGAVDAINADGYGIDPATIPFDELLTKIDTWGGVPFKVDSSSYRDLDGDGRQECLLRLVKDGGDYPNDVFAVMNLQDGKMYAYLIDSMTNYTIGDDGIFSSTDDFEAPFRILFDKDECLLYGVAQ